VAGDASANAFDAWIRALESRHLADLEFAEVSRALRALSSAYVERRSRLREGAALSGAGKRAAFALFYGPLHFLVVQHIARQLAESPAGSGFATIVDLGCGTGAAGAAWATASSQSVKVIGIDLHPWALAEAEHTYRHFGVSARTRRGDIAREPWPKGPAAFVAAFTINEIAERSRQEMLTRLLERGRRGDRILVIEPIAGSAAPWWNAWRTEFERSGGRADEWRFAVELPAIVEKLDRAAGLNHRELKARSLWIHTRQPTPERESLRSSPR